MNISKCVCLLICFFSAFASNNVNAQRNPSAKELTKLLLGTWEIKLLYSPNYDKMEDQYQYSPIDDENIDKYFWDEETFDESRYGVGFGLKKIEFLPKGKFNGEHYSGNRLSGTWRYQPPKRQRWNKFYLGYIGNMEEGPTAEQYPHDLYFDQVEFKNNQLILMGDTCHDGCVLKAVFEKIN